MDSLDETLGDDEIPCDLCGHDMLREVGAGRVVRGRGGVAVAVPDDVAILTCQGCGARMLDGEAMRRIGEAEDNAAPRARGTG